jgi:hypothetical protein
MEVSGRPHDPATLPPGEIAFGTHWIRSWDGPGVALDAVKKRKILQCRESNPGSPAHSPSLSRLTAYNAKYLLGISEGIISWKGWPMAFTA